jgi:hypothetical protein
MVKYPNKLELKALRELDCESPQRWAIPNVGTKTRASLLAKGWIVETLHPVTNESKYQTTDEGRAAIKIGLAPATPHTKQRLSALPPRIQLLK